MPGCTASPSLARLRFFVAFAAGVSVLCPGGAAHGRDDVDVVTYFQRASDARGAGLARKTKPVDVRPATPGEVIVTMIAGEGKETQSPPARPGDMVVWNRCTETGNGGIHVGEDVLSRRYDGP